MCVDKDPGTLADFEALAAEAALAGPDWALVFAAAISGQGGKPPLAGQITAALQRQVEAVKAGNLEGLIPFDRQGAAVPLAVMQFTGEVKWTPGDFFAAGLLLFNSGMADLLATRPAHTTRQKQFVGALGFVVFAVVWAELAVRLLD